MNPPLKWIGGKRWLVPLLRTWYAPHQHRRLVEPFCGGAAVAFGLLPKQALLNDVNSYLINFYRSLQQGLDFPVDMTNERETFFINRARFNALIEQGQVNTPEMASLFYYLNRACFNGICHYNRRGLMNGGFGSHSAIPDVGRLADYREAIQGCAFENRDFEELDLKPDDFIYADPPYDQASIPYFTSPFTSDDQARLARWLARHPGPVVVSNYASARIVALYRGLGFRLRFLWPPRNIRRNGGRAAVREVVAVKNLG